MMLQIITDSASDITLKQAEEMGIQIVPLNIQFSDGPCPQETDEDFLRFFDRLEKSEDLPVTSQPSPESYLACYKAAKAAGDTVLVLTLSSGLSGTINAAATAKALCGYEPVYIVDSCLAVGAQRILTEYAVELRAQNLEITELVQRVEAMREHITVFGVIDTLTYLRKGGRVPGSLAAIGNTLQIKPVIMLENKILKTIGRGLGHDGGKRFVYRQIEKHLPDQAFPIYFLYTSNREMGQSFMEQAIEKFHLNPDKCRLIPVGGVIGTHVGTNCVGIAYVME